MRSYRSPYRDAALRGSVGIQVGSAGRLSNHCGRRSLNVIVTMMFFTAFAALATTHGAAASAPKVNVDSPFNGLWIDELKTQMGEAGFDEYLIANGTYKCGSCTPPRSYPADGKLRPVLGDSSVISEGVVVTGPRSIRTETLARDMLRTTTMTVAHDGLTATYIALDKWPGEPKPLRTEYLARRVAPAPAGSHQASGSWQGIRYVAVPEEYRSVTLTEVGNSFARSNYRHGHYNVTIGGLPAIVLGDGQNTLKAYVRAPDVRTRVETISQDGKPLVERTYHLSADLSLMTTTVLNTKDGSVFSTTSHKKK